MTEMVPSGLMRGHWRRSDGAAYTGTKLETAETAKVHLHTTAPVLYSTCGEFPIQAGRGKVRPISAEAVRAIQPGAGRRQDAAAALRALRRRDEGGIR